MGSSPARLAAAPDPPAATAFDAYRYFATVAAMLREHGWEVNIALASGPVEQITFSAQRPPQGHRPCMKA